jgi:demethylmenaquinone methyltransferase/2-methoxy-6-polyprenyl-1,4-benzoquinol methylase
MTSTAAREHGVPSARKRHARELFAVLPQQYDRAGAVLGFGQDERWRRALVGTLDASARDRVLDVATGTGLVAQALVRRYGCAVVGVDQSPQMLAAARARMERDPRLAARVTLLEGEAERLPFADAEFDHLTFTYLLRYVDDPAATLRELARVVRPGGRIASLEFGVPRSPALRVAWSTYTRVGLPLVGRLFSRDWAHTGRFLATSIPDFYERLPLERQLREWEAAAIEGVRLQRMSFGAGLVIWGERAGERGDRHAG